MHILLVIVEFSIVLGIMVLVHEFGHFAMAKMCGVRVETFSIGFGPRLFGWRKGDTDYRLSALPLGGYVKMAGDNPTEEHRLDESFDVHGNPIPRSADEFNARPRWQRILIALAGPCANFILSLFLLTLVAKFHHEVDQYLTGPAVVDYVAQNTPAAKLGLSSGDTITRFGPDKNPTWAQIFDDAVLNLNRDVPVTFLHNGQSQSGEMHIVSGGDDSEPDPHAMTMAIGMIPREQNGPVGVYSVAAGDPAAQAGMQAGDKLVRIDSYSPHSVYALVAYLQDRHGAPASLLIERDGKLLNLSAVPQRLDNGAGDIEFRLGFTNQPSPVEVEHLPLGSAIAESIKDNRNDSTLILRVIKGMFTRHVSVRSLSGPVGIAQQIDMATQLGIWTLLRLMSDISLNLGIFNLLPMPLLDGGMIVFLLIESGMRRDLNQTIKERVYQVGFVCIIMFLAFVLFNDISKLHLMKP